MANLTTDALMIAALNKISGEVNRYLTLFVFICGISGNFLNILILLQGTLRSNPCVIYFLASSISSLGILLVGLPSRLIAGWISTDPTNTNAFLCKARIFLLYGFRTTTAWLIVFATIDRWLSSSLRITRRRWSSCKMAYRSLVIISSLSFCLWIESAFCYDTNLPDAPLRCYGQSHVCRVFNDLTYAISTVMIPSVLMLIFGFLTIHNINRSRRAIEPFVATIIRLDPSKRKKRRPHRRNQSSLTRMLILQVIFLTLCSLPQAMHQIYLTLTMLVVKSSLRLAIENFIVNFNFSLTYVGNASPFYIYTLTGTMFRQTLAQLVRVTIRRSYLYLCDVFADWNHFLYTIFPRLLAPRA